LEDQGVGGKMGSERILRRLAWGCGLDSTGSGQGPVEGCCECGDEPSSSCTTELVSISIHIGYAGFFPQNRQFTETVVLFVFVS
jgi:hypothetical protein